jgi:CheY-like chemotaxis protein
MTMTPGRYVRLSLSDTGEGMDAATLTRVFEPFFTTKAPGKGTGLGLATAHSIIQQLGGSIHVTSTVGNGTTFHLYLPIDEAPLNVAAPTDSVREGHQVGSETILLVEDDQRVRQFVSTVLIRHGYRVCEATSPHDAMQVANRLHHAIDLLLTDVTMPEMNGSDLAAHFAANYPDTRVLFMTGCPRPTSGQNALSSGDAPLLRKPFSAHTLLNKVRWTLTGRSDAA